ncbi:TetR/AcrR family transcriptional regulator [Paracoccus lutimaris]|uniref:TetR family transcriptional regulator n=1 Tax=Paracoccus lutimaris TaxID=1490030 RepID=A0A368Z2J4_9RHOB|nr:TetR family transcriptional regulator [Paracoccus lutimaris]RCW86672.1 TetR family transcriptional regulator [Paracoccus lutimaris]
MGRSSAEQAQQNRARIVEIASGMFRARGIEAVSVADIMAAAGMTVGGFYKHFASKEALVDEATALAFDEALALWGRILGKDDATAEALRARLVEQYLRPNPQRHCPIIAFAPHVARKDGDAAARLAYDKGTGALLGAFFGADPQAMAENRIAEADPEVLVLFAAMVGARVLGEAAGDADWVRAVKKAVVDAVAQQGSG